VNDARTPPSLPAPLLSPPALAASAPSVPPASSLAPSLPSLPSLPSGVLVARPGLGANCSSIGSVVDILFGVGAVGGMVVVGLTAWLGGREGAESKSGDAGDPGHAGEAGRPGDAAHGGDAGRADDGDDAAQAEATDVDAG
jgi:hypothetical protein